jgi:antitoxin component YwqK of YwqJK toxin-antitoxin module
MKKFMFIGAILISGIISAQNIQPKLEAYGTMVKATYYYENGQIRQDGYFKEGKLDGQWVSYDEKGNKEAVAEYSNGVKTGKWIFLGDKMLSEVNYEKGNITDVKNRKQETIAKN